MNNPTKISVCMVTYNHEDFIIQAINSVLMQKGDFTLQFIISDDGSLDQTGSICQKYAKKYPSVITFLPNKKNLGPHLNFQQAMNKIDGKYIAFCDGDDYWTDLQKLQKQMSFLEDNNDFNICFHPVKVLKRNGNLVKDFITHVPNSETTIMDLIKNGNYIHTPSVMFRNNFTFPPWYWNCPVGDYPLYFLAAKEAKIKCLSETMAVYRFGGSYSSLSPFKRKFSFLLTVGELIKNYPDDKIKLLLCQKQKKKIYLFAIIFLLLGRWDLANTRTLIKIFYQHKNKGDLPWLSNRS